MPGGKVCNLIVSKEKSVFRDERPCCVCLTREWTRGLEKRIVAVRLVIDEITPLRRDFTKAAVFSLGAFLPGKASTLFSTAPQALPSPGPLVSPLFRVAWQHLTSGCSAPFLATFGGPPRGLSGM